MLLGDLFGPRNSFLIGAEELTYRILGEIRVTS